MNLVVDIHNRTSVQFAETAGNGKGEEGQEGRRREASGQEKKGREGRGRGLDVVEMYKVVVVILVLVVSARCS